MRACLRNAQCVVEHFSKTILADPHHIFWQLSQVWFDVCPPNLVLVSVLSKQEEGRFRLGDLERISLASGLAGSLDQTFFNQNGQMTMHGLSRDPESIGRYFRDIIGMILDIPHDVLLDFVAIALNQRALRPHCLPTVDNTSESDCKQTMPIL